MEIKGHSILRVNRKALLVVCIKESMLWEELGDFFDVFGLILIAFVDRHSCNVFIL